MDDLTESISELNIENYRYQYCDQNDFDLIQNITFKEIHNFEIPFYGIWAMFTTFPKKKIVKNKIIYQHLVIDTDNKDIFFMFTNDENVKFTKTKNWKVSTNTNDKALIYNFISHMYTCLNCYYQYYHFLLSDKIFEHSDSIIDCNLKMIKKSIEDDHQKLKNY